MNEGGNKRGRKSRSRRNAKLKEATKPAVTVKTEPMDVEIKTEPENEKATGASSSVTVKKEKEEPGDSISIEMEEKLLCNDHCRLRLCIKGGRFGYSYFLKRNVKYFGGSVACDTCFTNLEYLVVKHCCVTVDDHDVASLDPLSTTRITYLNGEILQRSEILSDDDVISIGVKNFRFNYALNAAFSLYASPTIFVEKLIELAEPKPQTGKLERNIKKASEMNKGKSNTDRMNHSEESPSFDSSDDNFDDLFESEDDDSKLEGMDPKKLSSFSDESLRRVFGNNPSTSTAGPSGQKRGPSPAVVNDESSSESSDDTDHDDRETAARTFGFSCSNSDFASLSSFYRNRDSLAKLNNKLNSLSASYRDTREREKRLLKEVREYKGPSECKALIKEVLKKFMSVKNHLYRQDSGELGDPLRTIAAIRDTTRKISIIVREIEKRNKFMKKTFSKKVKKRRN